MIQRGLYIGRFQPLHRGHMDALDQFCNGEALDEVCIVIGSSEQDYEPIHPLTAGERVLLWRIALSEAGYDLARFLLIPVPDIANSASYVHHMLRHVPPITAMAAGSPLTHRLFADARPDIKRVMLEDRTGINATRVRLAMRDSNEPLDELLTPMVLEQLEQWDIASRLVDIHSTGFSVSA